VALASQPGIEAGPITDVTVDGHRAKYVELTVATDITTCPVDVGKIHRRRPLRRRWRRCAARFRGAPHRPGGLLPPGLRLPLDDTVNVSALGHAVRV
jgi:hypothetical protein